MADIGQTIFYIVNVEYSEGRAMNGYDLTAGILKALAHPVRLQILEVLDEEGEACVCHLEWRLDQRQAYISQQLAKLREAGLVEDRREGLNVFYRLGGASVSQLVQDAVGIARANAKTMEIALEPHLGGLRASDPCPCPSCQARQSALVRQADGSEA